LKNPVTRAYFTGVEGRKVEKKNIARMLKRCYVRHFVNHTQEQDAL